MINPFRRKPSNLDETATNTVSAPVSEHCMLDLETLGKRNNAALMSLGITKFNPFTNEIMDTFYVPIDPESCQALGLTIDVSTVMWWMDDKRNAARSEMMLEERVDLPSALYGLVDWFGEDKPVWGNGSTFDNVIIRSAFAACSIEPPWSFWNDKCYRTLKGQAPSIKLVREGTFHNALADAISQTKHMQAVVSHLGLREL